MAGYEAPAGTIRYIDQGVGKRPIKEKYYVLRVDYGEYGYFGNYPNIYFVDTIKWLVDNEVYHQFIPDSIVQFLPDSAVNIDGLGIVSPRVLSGRTSIKWFFSGEEIESSYYEQCFFTGEPEEGEQICYRAGKITYAGWASYDNQNEKEEKDEESSVPRALDKDYTEQDVTEKQQDIQIWSNDKLLPPIFGLKNCVYFPSDLASYTISNAEKDPWGIISQYPVFGLSFTSKEHI